MAKPKEVPAANTYRFEGVPIRIVFVADDPWFYAADVLDALKVGRDLLDQLADQPGAINANRDDPLISEAGLFRLLTEINSDAGRRYKRWLAADLLPSLYRDEYIVRLREMVNDARLLAGEDSKRGKHRHVTDEEKAEIRKLAAEGWTGQALSRKFRRGDSTIYAIIKGRLP